MKTSGLDRQYPTHVLRIIVFVLSSFLIITCEASAQFLGQQSLSRSSYIIDKSGRLFTFGWNVYGQLGVGDKTDRNTLTEVPVPPGASRWTLAAGGAQHALAVADSDKLYAWGSNRYGLDLPRFSRQVILSLGL